jgi:hypothetical protein
MTTIKRISFSLACAAFIGIAVGCNSPAGMVVQVVGKVVDDEKAKKLAEELLGKRAAAADEKFGQPNDVWKSVNDSREWRVYPVSMDIMGNLRYVVQLSRGRIDGISKVAIDKSGIDMARSLMLDQKVDGKTPSQCQAALEMGSPVVTAKSQNTGLMSQLYNAQLVKGVGSPQYCRLLFDANGRCNECKLIDVSASAGQAPPS